MSSSDEDVIDLTKSPPGSPRHSPPGSPLDSPLDSPAPGLPPLLVLDNEGSEGDEGGASDMDQALALIRAVSKLQFCQQVITACTDKTLQDARDKAVGIWVGCQGCLKLLAHQQRHLECLQGKLATNVAVVDRSPMGTGKTPVALWLANNLRARDKVMRLPAKAPGAIPGLPTFHQLIVFGPARAAEAWSKWCLAMGMQDRWRFCGYEVSRGEINVLKINVPVPVRGGLLMSTTKAVALSKAPNDPALQKSLTILQALMDPQHGNTYAFYILTQGFTDGADFNISALDIAAISKGDEMLEALQPELVGTELYASIKRRQTEIQGTTVTMASLLTTYGHKISDLRAKHVKELDLQQFFSTTPELMALLRQGALVVFDEAHALGDDKSATFKAAQAVMVQVLRAQTTCKVIFASATPTDKQKSTKAFSQLGALANVQCAMDTQAYVSASGQEVLQVVQNALVWVDQDTLARIEAVLENIQKEIYRMQANKTFETSEGEENLQQMMQELEAVKLQLMLRVAESILTLHKTAKVILALMYNKTLQSAILEFNKMKHSPVVVCGDVTVSQGRPGHIRDFNSPDTAHRVMVANLNCISSSIDLHDTHGGFPRVILCAPTWFHKDLHQLVGRHYRAGVQSHAVTWVVKCANQKLAQSEVEHAVEQLLSSKAQLMHATWNAAGASKGGVVMDLERLPSVVMDEQFWQQDKRKVIETLLGLDVARKSGTFVSLENIGTPPPVVGRPPIHRSQTLLFSKIRTKALLMEAAKKQERQHKKIHGGAGGSGDEDSEDDEDGDDFGGQEDDQDMVSPLLRLPAVSGRDRGDATKKRRWTPDVVGEVVDLKTVPKRRLAAAKAQAAQLAAAKAQAEHSAAAAAGPPSTPDIAGSSWPEEWGMRDEGEPAAAAGPPSTPDIAGSSWSEEWGMRAEGEPAGIFNRLAPTDPETDAVIQAFSSSLYHRNLQMYLNDGFTWSQAVVRLIAKHFPGLDPLSKEPLSEIVQLLSLDVNGQKLANKLDMPDWWTKIEGDKYSGSKDDDIKARVRIAAICTFFPFLTSTPEWGHDAQSIFEGDDKELQKLKNYYKSLFAYCVTQCAVKDDSAKLIKFSNKVLSKNVNRLAVIMTLVHVLLERDQQKKKVKKNCNALINILGSTEGDRSSKLQTEAGFDEAINAIGDATARKYVSDVVRSMPWFKK